MGKLIRSKDWTQTPLGAPNQWPQSLKTCVRIILTSRQPMFVWWGNELINIYNDAYMSIVGGKHPECLGQPASEVWKEIWDEVGTRAAIVMEQNIGTYDEALLLMMERNGYTEETYYTFSYSPVPGDDGTTQGIICANTDDTQRIIGERQLRTLKELARNILNINSNAEIYKRALDALQGNPQDFPFIVLYEASDDGKQLRLVQHLPQELPATIAPEHINLDTQAQQMPEIAQALRTGKIQKVTGIQQRFGVMPTSIWPDAPYQALLIPILQANHEFPFAIMCVGVNPYRLLDEGYVSFLSLTADQISNALTNAYSFKQERKRAEALAEIDKAKTLFFSNISHEFRTPLTLMLGPLEELLKSGAQNPSDQENIAVTHRNAIRLLRLVNALLDFSRIEAGRMKARFEPVCLAELTTNLVSAFRSAIEKGGLSLEIHADIPSSVYVDREMWEKIVMNLMSNAFKYTLSGGITVRMYERDDKAVIAFSDTGIGIPEDEIPRLFERFHRVKNAVGRSFEGTGIGLSLVRELVALHHGHIEASSQHGKGTTFTVTLPLGHAHLPDDQIVLSSVDADDILPTGLLEETHLLLRPTPPASFGQSSLKPRILLVDDNIDMQQYVSKLLARDYEVAVASNGQMALDAIAMAQPDLVISDIMMPVMDGIELLKNIKNDVATRRIPVLLLSARAGEESKIEGYDLGADDYLVKPFSAKELLARVQSQIRLARTRSHIDGQLHNLFYRAPVAISILRGPDFVIEMANAKMLGIWNKSHDVIGKKLFEEMPTARQQGFDQLLEQVYHTGEPFAASEIPFEQRVNGKPHRIFIKFAYEPLREEDGTISGIMVMADDITNLVQARKNVEVVETRNKLAIEAADMGHFEWDMVSDEFIYSERFAELFGFQDQNVISRKDFSSRIHPDDAPVRAEAHRRAHQNGMLSYEARVVYPDESVHWLRFNGKIIFGDDHQPLKMYGTSLDVTQQRIQSQVLEEKVTQRTKALIQRNHELKLSEERYQRMTEEVQDYAIIALDRDGTVLNWNKGAQNIKGYHESEIVGRNFRLFYRKEDLENKLPDRLLQQAEQTGRSMDEGYRVRKDGSYFWASIAITALHDKDNNVIGFSKVTRDLTERKLAEDRMKKYNAELEFQNKELEQFAYVASHDLQEPLRKIQMFTGLLERSLDDEQAKGKYFSKISQTAERMSELIRAVLNYSRLSRNDQQFEQVDLQSVLESVLVDFELLIEEKHAQITYDALPVLTAIPLQINQLFSNLIGNSIKFSDKAPKIEVKARRCQWNEIPDANFATGEYLELVISDNGIGFDQKYLGKIFTIFQRLNDRVNYSGTGIGLALCKKIVENHSGYITARSAPGDGASFFIYLPYRNHLTDGREAVLN